MPGTDQSLPFCPLRIAGPTLSAARAREADTVGGVSAPGDVTPEGVEPLVGREMDGFSARPRHACP